MTTPFLVTVHTTHDVLVQAEDEEKAVALATVGAGIEGPGISVPHREATVVELVPHRPRVVRGQPA